MTLRVVLQIIPAGDENRAREIARLDISNIGSAEFDEFNNRKMRGQGWFWYRVIESNQRTGYLHDRAVTHVRSDSAWELVKKVLAKLDMDKP